jgi:hypothetical protein
MKTFIAFLCTIGLICSTSLSKVIPSHETKSEYKKAAKIQLALLLDTSSSMSGLIEQAKAKLWNIVNEMSEKKGNGQDVQIEIALYEYGHSRLSERTGWIRQITPFTTNIDLVSERLFSLSTQGGDEFCGQVIDRSLKELEWDHQAAYKVIFIAGNESFAQGPIPFQSVCQQAAERNIVVNTIYCGDYNQGIQLLWKAGADAGNGDFFVINQNEEIQFIKTPYDDDISKLNLQLNKTYVPIGKDGRAHHENQTMQDSNAGKYGSSNVASRAVFKSRSQYNNANWDLIDAYEDSKDVIKNKKDLPAGYQDLSTTEVEHKILKLKVERQEIKEEIQSLGKTRSNYIKEQRKTQQATGLEDSMLKSIRNQMKSRGLSEASLQPSNIDETEFFRLSGEVLTYRKDRLLELDGFLNKAAQPGAIILDTRSKWAYDAKHIKGAIHINFSDFSEEKLAKVIPNKETPVLIYCNNNFFGDPVRFVGKAAPLALNIPTFINLYGYGYKNVYELANYVSVDDERLSFASNVAATTK